MLFSFTHRGLEEHKKKKKSSLRDVDILPWKLLATLVFTGNTNIDIFDNFDKDDTKSRRGSSPSNREGGSEM